MTIQSALYSQLSTYAGLIALVSTRTYPGAAPDTVADPYCVFFQVSRRPVYTHQGATGLSEYRMQVSCFAKTYDSVKAIAAQVELAMEAWMAANSNVQACFLDDEQDINEEESEYYHVPLDFLVQYGE